MRLMRLTLALAAVAGLAGGEAEERREEIRGELQQLAERTHLSKAFNLIHELVAPSVVSIHINQQRLTWNRSEGTIERREVEVGEGSGFVVHSDDEHSYLLTNAHVALQSNRNQEFIRDHQDRPVWHSLIRVVLNDKRMYEGIPVGVDPETDIAVLKIAEPGLPAIEWGDSDEVEVGDWVLALGYPLGVGYSASAGIISATGRSTGIYRAEQGYEAFLQTDAAINPGNSGGPLVDVRGRIVGVNSNIISGHGKNIGIGFAIVSNLARTVAEDIIADGRVSRPMIGIQMSVLAPADVEELGLERPRGVKIEFVMPKSPAEEAGLEAGDVVVGVDGREVAGMQQFRTRIASARIGQTVEVAVLRDGEERNLAVEPMSWEAYHRLVADGPAGERLGVVGLASFGFKIRKDHLRGVKVVGVEEGGPAAEAGLRVGDRILRVGGLGFVENADDLAALDERADELVMEVYRRNRVVLMRIRKGE